MPAAIALTSDQRRWFDRVVRMVCERLRETGGFGAVSTSDEQTAKSIRIEDRVVTLDTLQTLPDGVAISVVRDAVFTPAAKDEMRQRGIRVGSADSIGPQSHGTAGPTSRLSGNGFSEAIANQLHRRGVDWPRESIELSDEPEQTVWKHHGRGKRAAVCHRLPDVARLQRTFAPEVWVIPTADRSLVETVNLVAAVDRLTRSPSFHPKPR